MTDIIFFTKRCVTNSRQLLKKSEEIFTRLSERREKRNHGSKWTLLVQLSAKQLLTKYYLWKTGENSHFCCINSKYQNFIGYFVMKKANGDSNISCKYPLSFSSIICIFFICDLKFYGVAITPTPELWHLTLPPSSGYLRGSVLLRLHAVEKTVGNGYHPLR